MTTRLAARSRGPSRRSVSGTEPTGVHGADFTIARRDDKATTTTEYYSTRDADDVKLGLPTQENPQGITGGTSHHEATHTTEFQEVLSFDIWGLKHFNTYGNGLNLKGLRSSISIYVPMVETNTRTESDRVTYTESATYDEDGVKSGDYSETTEATFHEHRTRSDWVGVEGFNYGPSHEYLPPPPPLDSTSEKKSTSGRTGHYDADKLTETVTLNGVSGGKKDYPLGGSRQR